MRYRLKNQFGFTMQQVLLLSVVLCVFLAVVLMVKKSQPAQVLTREGVVTDIQKLAQLHSVAYQVDTIVTATKQGTWQKLWQDEQKGIFVVKGRVLAGVDLGNIDENHVQVTQQSDAPPQIMIKMPPTQIFEVFLDDIVIYDWQTGLFGTVAADSQMFSQVQNDAKSEVLRKACQGDVLSFAMNNAAEQLKGLFSLSGAQVQVITQGSGACQIPTRASK